MSESANGQVPLMSAEDASKVLDRVVYEHVRELFDFFALLDFEQQLWQELRNIGYSRERCPIVSAELIARALTRIGEEHMKLAADFDNLPYTPD